MLTNIRMIDEVVIAGAPPKRHRAFPALQRLQDGDIVCAFREGSDHWVTPDGRVRLTRSTDDGQTWSEPVTIREEARWNWGQHHAMTQLADGTLLLPVTRARTEYVRPGGGVVVGPRILNVYLPHRHAGLPVAGRVPRRMWAMLRSQDGGRTWPEQHEIDVPGLSNADDPGYPWGRIQELPDGRVMMPISGHVDGLAHTGVAFSSDRGATWDGYAVIGADPVERIGFNETDITRLPDGRWLAMIRQGTVRPYWLYQSYSSDDGATWTQPRATTIVGHAPGLHVLPSGAVLCVYRDKRPKKEGVSLSVSYDAGETWLYVGQFWTSPGYTNDCGYPSLVRLPNDDVLCAFYTPFVEANNEIHAWVLREGQLV
jgi:hypothetical protein